MENLALYDLHQCVKRLPWALREAMKKHSNIIVAGGYIRSIIANEKLSDIDCFAGTREVSEIIAENLQKDDKKLFSTNNAFTVMVNKTPVQFIYRWVFDSPHNCIQSFDFTICQAAFWYNQLLKKWDSVCSSQFYPDLASKRLIYTWPTREEEAGGSILRVLKYYQRGYRIPLDSFAAVIARLMQGVQMNEITDTSHLAHVLAGLLFEVDPNEVDPNGFVDHEAYLPKVEDLINSQKENIDVSDNDDITISPLGG